MGRRMSSPDGFAGRIARFIDAAPIDDEAKTRYRLFTVFLFLGIPTMAVFGAYNLLEANYLLCSLIFTSATGLLGGWYLLGRSGRREVIYRINTFLFGLLLVYMLIFGGEDGSKILWMYTFPLIAFFLLGKNEGLLWNGGISAVSLALFLHPPAWPRMYPYDIQFKIRFLASFVIVSVVAYGFEYLREKYFLGMQLEKRKLEEEQEKLRKQILEREKEALIGELQATLVKVKQLSGLLPICSSCKKIRDDKGYWNRIELYLQEHSEAEFSHGICPDCARELYPEYSPGEPPEDS